MAGCFLTPMFFFPRPTGPARACFNSGNLITQSCAVHVYALEEARINLAEEEQRARLTKVSEAVHWFDAAQRKLPRGISLPEKDVPIILAAIEARATHLLTGDVRHFGPYFGKKIEGIAIVLPGEYLRMLTGGA